MHFLTPLFEGTRTGWTMLAIAAIVLISSIVVLARLRWIQSRPIATCIVLSVLAHALLVVSAYMTRFFDVPAWPGDPGIRVRLADTSLAATSHPPVSQRWDALSVEPPPAPTMTPLPELPAEPTDAPPAVPLASEALPTLKAEVPAPAAPLVVDRPIDGPARPGSAPSPAGQEFANSSDVPSTADLPDSVAGPEMAAVEDEHWQPGGDTGSHRAAESKATAPAPPSASRPDRAPSERLPARYRARLAVNRDEILRQRGGNADTEAAVQAGLAWLAANQSADGGWDASQHGGGRGQLVEGHFRGPAGLQADAGISGLALLAFLGAGHTHLHGDHTETVRRGLEYLLRVQAGNGDLAGNATNFARMYCHGMATLALNEAVAMTGDERLLPFAELGTRYSLGCQHPTTGGWRYRPGDQGDMSQFGWQLMAIASGEQAGLRIPSNSFQGMRRFLASVTRGDRGGLASYRPGSGATRAMTAEAMACRGFLGIDDPAADEEATEFLMDELPSQGAANLYYWYYATLALSQTDSAAWQSWNHSLQATLLPRQRQDGSLTGSWDCNTVWGGHGGRVYSTALATLCLEVYYRYPLRAGR